MQRDPRTIQRHIEKMEKQGYIKRERRFIPGIGSRPLVRTTP
jgi:DNA-binding MarR family transcriptional regulator